MSVISNLAMIGAAGAGGGPFFFEGVLTEGAIGGSTPTPGMDVNVTDHEAHFLSDGTTVHCYGSTGTLSDGVTRADGAMYLKLDTDGTVLWSKRVANQLAGDATTYPRCYNYGSCVDNDDNLYIVGQVNYVSTPYGTNTWPYILKVDTSDGSVQKLMVYSLYNASFPNADRGWFRDITINKKNGNIMCAGVNDVTGVGYRGCIYEINPTTLNIVASRLIGNGGTYFNAIDTDIIGNIYVGGYDNYAYSSVIKLNSSYTVQTSKNIDDNGGLIEKFREKNGALYIPRNDGAILSGYTSTPLSVTKLDCSNLSVIWSQAYADSSFNGYGARIIRFDSNGDVIVSCAFPTNYRSITGTNTIGSGIAKFLDSNGALSWVTIITPYAANAAAAAQYRLYQYGLDVNANDFIATTAQNFFYYNVSASDYVQVKNVGASVYEAINLEGANFTSDATALYSSDDVSYPRGLKIVDVTSNFNISGVADSTGSFGISTSVTNPTVAATDATSQVQIADVTYSEENIINL